MMTTTLSIRLADRRPRGRPTAAATAERDKDLLVVAAELFGRDGLAGTSVNEIARLTGISKTTIYARYEDKAALFRAICSFACRVPTDAFRAVEVAGRDPRAVLSDFAAAARAGFLSDDATDLLRLMIFEARRFPEIAALVLDESRRSYAPLTDYLVMLARDEAIGGDPVILADQFVTLVTGGYQTLLAPPPLDSSEKNGEDPALTLFLAGIGVSPSVASRVRAL